MNGSILPNFVALHILTLHKTPSSSKTISTIPRKSRKRDRSSSYSSNMKQQPQVLLIAIFVAATATLSKISAQSPAAAPAPAGPTNVTAILEKAGQFSTFIRLLGNTQEDDQINQQLNNSNQGLTIFAPTDNAFSSLPAGTLNSLNDQEKVELIQFHVLPTGIPLSQFQTASNPLRTQAGDTGSYEFPLNVTTNGNTVNITTGLVNTTVSNTLYTDGQLYVYQVDQVLLPLQLFGPHPPAEAPAPAMAKPKKAKSTDADSSDNAADNTSDSSQDLKELSFGASILAAVFFMLI